jgi:hypothetical protein
MFDDVGNFSRANVCLEKFLELFTTDVRRKPADKELALLEFFCVAFNLGLL